MNYFLHSKSTHWSTQNYWSFFLYGHPLLSSGKTLLFLLIYVTEELFFSLFSHLSTKFTVMEFFETNMLMWNPAGHVAEL